MKVRLGPAKGKDWCTALGPVLVTPDEIGNPYDLRMTAHINGELWSEGNSKTMHWTFEEMIEFVSKDESLSPATYSARAPSEGDADWSWTAGCSRRPDGIAHRRDRLSEQPRRKEGEFMNPMKKGKTASQAHVGIPEGTFEEEHGRKGFFGKAAHLYHTHPPTAWTRFEGPLRPHCFDCNALHPTDQDDPRGVPLPFLASDDVQVSVSRRTAPMPFFFRNADGDELYFIHRGRGFCRPISARCRSLRAIIGNPPFGHLPHCARNEGQFLPDHSVGRGIRSTRKRTSRPARTLRPRGDCHPEPHAYPDDGREREVRIKADGQLSSVFYPFNPLDVVGWKGDLTVWKLSVSDIRPVMSHRMHLPPSVHTTFVTQGAVVCSFVPVLSKKMPMLSRSPSSTGTPTMTSSFSIMPATFSAATTSSPAWPPCIRGGFVTVHTPEHWRIRGRKHAPMSMR